jgi:hypothetical protein
MRRGGGGKETDSAVFEATGAEIGCTRKEGRGGH